MHPLPIRPRYRGLPGLRALAAASVLWLGAAQAQAQPVCEVDVARTGTELVPVSTSTTPSDFQMRFAVSPGCAKVIQTGPLRISFFVAIFNSATATSGGPVAAEQHFENHQPVHTGYGPAAANGYSPRRSYWDFPAAEVQAAADSGGYLQIPLRLTTDRGLRGFRYFLTRTSADRHLNNADRQATRSLAMNEPIQIGTANRASFGSSPGRGGSRGFDQTTKDPTASSHPDTPGGGVYPRSDYYRFHIPAGYPATPAASASPEVVNEGQEFMLSSSGSRLPSIPSSVVSLIRGTGFNYSLDWVQVTDASGATEVGSGEALSIPTENGILIRTGFFGNTFSLRLKHGTVTAPQVTEPTRPY